MLRRPSGFLRKTGRENYKDCGCDLEDSSFRQDLVSLHKYGTAQRDRRNQGIWGRESPRTVDIVPKLPLGQPADQRAIFDGFDEDAQPAIWLMGSA